MSFLYRCGDGVFAVLVVDGPDAALVLPDGHAGRPGPLIGVRTNPHRTFIATGLLDRVCLLLVSLQTASFRSLAPAAAAPVVRVSASHQAK